MKRRNCGVSLSAVRASVPVLSPISTRHPPRVFISNRAVIALVKVVHRYHYRHRNYYYEYDNGYCKTDYERTTVRVLIAADSEKISTRSERLKCSFFFFNIHRISNIIFAKNQRVFFKYKYIHTNMYIGTWDIENFSWGQIVKQVYCMIIKQFFFVSLKTI